MTAQPSLTLARRFGITDKVIVVTGASVGIGRGIALNLAQLGAQVVVTAGN
jgi:NAD(P)-dependent dehydrogenase (short-subunit alcohol dehydrogenase family)